MSQIFGPKGGGTPAPGTVLFLEGNTGGQVGPDVTGTIFVVGSGDVNVAGSPLSDTLTISITPGSFIQTVDGNSGHASGSTITLTTGASNAQGTALVTGDNAQTLTITFTDSNTNTGIGSGVFSNPSFSGSDNTALGRRAGFANTSATGNTFIGSNAGISVSTGGGNTIVGQFGAIDLVTGTGNTILGTNSGSNYGGAESDNVLINDSGIHGESNALHIGVSSGLTAAYIGGIYGVTPLIGSPLSVVIDSAGQLGTASSAPIMTIDGNTGTASGATVTITTGASNADGTALFTGDGVSTITQTFTDASFNVGLGTTVLSNNTLGTFNSALGYTSLFSCEQGTGNSSVGSNSLSSLIGTGINDASFNVGMGYFSGNGLTSGSFNIILGSSAGNNYSSSESNNIIIGNSGVTGESNVVRIGTTGSGSQEQSTTYIAGISGVNVGSVASVVSISGDQLGSTVITPGTGITVTPGANTITIAATGGTGFTWNNVTTPTQAMAVHNGYIANDPASLVTLTLPATAAVGTTLWVSGASVDGWTIVENSGQNITFGSDTTTTTTGSLSSTQQNDSVQLLCTVANTTWNVITSMGNITIV
jgi:hypothetical protein